MQKEWFLFVVGDVTLHSVSVLAEHCTWLAMWLELILQFNFDGNYLANGAVVYRLGIDGNPLFVGHVVTWTRGIKPAHYSVLNFLFTRSFKYQILLLM